MRKNNLDISLCDYDAKFVIDTIHLCGGIAVLAHPNTDAISKRNQEYNESKVIELAKQLDVKKLLKKKPNLVEQYTEII